MRTTLFRAVSLALATASASVPANAAPCAGFADVDDTSTFCANVEWIRNRGVTNGCATDRFCPGEPVSRLQLAAFMNRLGDAFKLVTIWTEDAIEALPTLPGNICATNPLPAAGYPRKASATGRIELQAGSTAGYAAQFVWSHDDFATVQYFGAVLPQHFTLYSDPLYGGFSTVGSMASGGDAAIPAGTTVRFAIRVIADPTTTSAMYNCQIRVQARLD